MYKYKCLTGNPAHNEIVQQTPYYCIYNVSHMYMFECVENQPYAEQVNTTTKAVRTRIIHQQMKPGILGVPVQSAQRAYMPNIHNMHTHIAGDTSCTAEPFIPTRITTRMWITKKWKTKKKLTTTTTTTQTPIPFHSPIPHCTGVHTAVHTTFSNALVFVHQQQLFVW